MPTTNHSLPPPTPQKIAVPLKSSPNGEILPNLVTLFVSYEEYEAQLKHFLHLKNKLE
jgi:hypothetical protein